jgi:hypothetical protein
MSTLFVANVLTEMGRGELTGDRSDLFMALSSDASRRWEGKSDARRTGMIPLKLITIGHSYTYVRYREEERKLSTLPS